VTKDFPAEEKYGLTNQIRRSAVSIPSNIAEGAARKSNREYIQFLHIALGSTAELETQLIIASNLKYMAPDESECLNSKLETISKLIVGLIKYVKGRL
jgi:four helix bundle protein